MNINLIELKRENLLKILSNNISPISNLFTLTNYLSELLEQNDTYLVEAFFNEFQKKYLLLLAQFEPSGLHPEKAKIILDNAEKFLNISVGTNYYQEINSTIILLRNKWKIVVEALEGYDTNILVSGSIKFPVLEIGNGAEASFGFVEEINIAITKSYTLKNDKFIVVPNLGEIESRLEKQINTSWGIAKNYLKQFANQINSSHEVVIQFEKQYGLYVGESLGIALTIGFIQELIKYYDLRQSVIIKANIASTGGIENDKKVKSVSHSVIVKKINTVFFSNVQKFIIPQEDYNFAQAELSKLKTDFPKRKLQIIGIETISDLLNRRDIIDIKKQNIFLWGSKKAIKNKLALILIFIITIFSGYFLLKNIDNNPVSVEFENNDRSPYLTAYVKNKYGNIIWIKSPEASGVLYRKYPSLSNKLYNIIY